MLGKKTIALSGPTEDFTVSSVSHLRTLVELLQQRAQGSPSDIAHRLLSAEGAAEALTYAQLDRQARAIAADYTNTASMASERRCCSSRPVWTIWPPFFGCVCASVAAVAAHPPHGPRAVSSIGLDRAGRAGRGCSRHRRACRSRESHLAWTDVDSPSDHLPGRRPAAGPGAYSIPPDRHVGHGPPTGSSATSPSPPDGGL